MLKKRKPSTLLAPSEDMVFSAIQNRTGFARQNQTIGLSQMSLALA